MFSKQGGFWQSVVGSLCALHWSGCDVASPIDGPVQTPPDERASKDMTLSPPILTVPAPREPGGCAPGSFERVAATPAEPAECVPVSACRAGEVEVAPAAATSDRICG